MDVLRLPDEYQTNDTLLSGRAHWCWADDGEEENDQFAIGCVEKGVGKLGLCVQHYNEIVPKNKNKQKE